MIRSFIKKNHIEYYENISLKKYNNYRLDTKAKYIFFPKNIEELIKLLKLIKDNKLKYVVLGNGSNVIFKDEYYDGIVIKLDKFNNLKIDKNKIIVGAGYPLIGLVQETVNNNLSGLEFAAGIPGYIGASVAMNAGAYKHSISEVVESVKVINSNLEVIDIPNNKLEFSYRNSIFKSKKDYIIIECTLKLIVGSKEEMLEKIVKRKQKRIKTQPLELPSAGSVFRNPDNLFAGKLIEDSNLKGYRVGGAMISEKHANFIVNIDKAKGIDIIKIIDKVKKEVKNNYDVDLILEQIIID